jgi:prephenate dehydratase
MSVKLAYQGKPGAYAHKAALHFANKYDNNIDGTFQECNSFEDVFKSISAQKNIYGVIPIENSSIGSIVHNFDLLAKYGASIFDEVLIPIHHCLIGLPNTKLENIRSVFSHPVAIDQCRNFLEENPNISAIAKFDTGGSAAHIAQSKDKTCAAIAGEEAAKIYNLEIICSNIEDFKTNSTRFLLIGSDNNSQLDFSQVASSQEYAKTSAARKHSCVFELKHEPGTLSKIINELTRLKVNLSKIESRPIPQQPFERNLRLCN